MEQFEFNRAQPAKAAFESIPPSLEDFDDSPKVRALLMRIPEALRVQQMIAVEDLPEDEALEHLQGFLEKRENASRESEVSEPTLKEYFDTNSKAVWKALETNVFNDTENLLGSGTTARIQRFKLGEIDANAPVETLAIKYLISPTDKTLSVSGEHDLIREVERIEKIEKAEKANIHPTEYIRVPHPYFYYRNGKTQCYGMEEIEGVNLEQGTDGRFPDSEMKESIKKALSGVDREAFMEEVDRFFDTMHEICLHGDVKPKNLMISRTGQFYVIDFGQSVLASDVDDKSREAFDNIKDDEKKNAKLAFRYFLDSLKD